MALAHINPRHLYMGESFIYNVDGSVSSHKKLFQDLSDQGVKVSQGNPGPPFRSGGVFLKKKVRADVYPSGFVICSPNGQGPTKNFYRGSFIPAINYATSSSYVEALNLNPAVWGATGFARCKPGNPTASVGQFLIELRDLPRIPFQQLSKFRDLGSEYLNVVFGWKPFVQDLISMYNTFANLRAQLERLVANRGKPIKRRMRLGNTESVSTSSTTSPFGNVWLYPSTGTVSFPSTKTVDVTTHQDFEFSGTFKYWIPDLGENLWTNKATYALFGLNPTPKLLWDVIPWTWLIGWCSNIGDVLANISSNAVDSLVADHAYVVGKHTRVTTTTVNGGQMSLQGTVIPVTCSASITDEVLHRVPASPYGFGILPTSLDAGQIAILSALGISRHW